MRDRGRHLLGKMLNNLNPPKPDDRLGLLAVEIGLAGAQVLQEDYGFTQAQSAEWLDKMLSKAKVNRAATLAYMAVKEIDGDKP